MGHAHSKDQKQGECQWGGLVKGLLAGAAIVAGVALVCPGLLESCITTLKSVGGALMPEATKKGGEAMSGTVIYLAKAALGIALAAVGYNYLTSEKKPDHQDHHHRDESFALNHDMNKMKTVMMLRQQSCGHQPAMGGCPGR